MLSISVDTSDICNLLCEYCRVEQGDTVMGLEQFKGIVAQHPDAWLVAILGGEPLLHPELDGMVEAVLQAGKTVAISTNLYENAERLQQLKDVPIQKLTVQVTLPASNPELYAEVTKVEGFEQVTGNIAALKGVVPLVAHYVVYKRNLHNVAAAVDYAITKLGIPIRITPGYPVGNAVDAGILDHPHMLSLAETVSKKRVEYGRRVISGIGFADPTCREVVIPCSANATAFGIKNGPGECNHNKLFYNVHGAKSRCEFMRR